ncbi:MAG: RagB/SusD family nutrient uptake outer membrane protein [Bacteroidia bacterium]|nr:RagB/SusD family nutrient uptake outer membrane protein [Bacteroidia bacterium]
MNKSYIVRLFAVAVLAAATAGCIEQLDLKPAQSIAEEVALSTDENVQTVLAGAYDALSDQDLYGGSILRNAELLGTDNELSWVGTFSGPREIYNKDMTVGNTDAEALWIDAYQTINIANNVLSALATVNDDDRARVEGEALFIRGLCYFDLVRYFGKQYEAGQANSQPGVPLVLDPTRGVTDANNVARSTVEQVYAQVILDLTRAEEVLPLQIDAPDGWRATKGAAGAALARVYLQKGDYAQARDAASRVIESGEYSLLSNFSAVFARDENSSEDIFSIQVDAQDGTNYMNTFFTTREFGGRDGDIVIEQPHLDLYEEDDDRATMFFEDGGTFFTSKWNNLYGNVTIFRLAEMYLIRAECNQRLSTATGATPLDDYNEVHTRAGLAAATGVTLEDILLERRLELAFEGFRIHDVRRLKQNVGNRPYNDDKLVFPIPQREIVVNANLAQNSGY